MNVTDEKFARPVLYIYFMHGFTIFFGLPLHLVMFYAVITKTPLYAKKFSKKLLLHIGSSFAAEIFFTSLSTPVLFLPIPAGQAEGILEMMGISTCNLFGIGMVLLFFAGNVIGHLHYHRFIHLSVYNNVFHIGIFTTIFKTAVQKFFGEKFRTIVVLLLYAVSIGSIFPLLYLTLPDQEATRQELARMNLKCLNPRIVEDRTLVFSLNPEASTIAFMTSVKLAILYFVAILSLYYFFGGMTYYIISTSQKISERTKTLQKRFQWAMIMEAIVYMLVLVIPVICLIVIFTFDVCLPGVIR